MAAWRTRWAKTDAPRLGADVASAFVDRAPIDWASLLTRVKPGADKDLLEHLRLLDGLRAPATMPAVVQPSRRADVAVLLTVVAGVQTVVALLAIAASGHVAPDRGAEILLTLAFAAGCLLLGGVRGRDRRRQFLLATFSCLASAFARAALSGVAGPGPAWWTFLFRGIYPEAFAPAALWSFAVDFPRVCRFTTFDRLARRITAAAWLLGLALFGVNVAVGYGLVAPDAALGRNHPGNLYWHLVALSTLPAVLAIFIRARRAEPNERRKVGRFALALAAGAAPFLLFAVARMALPPVNRWFLSAGRVPRAWIDMLVVGGLAMMPTLSATAIVVDRAFEFQPIDAGSRRGRFVRAALTATVAAPFAAVAAILYRFRHLPVDELLSGPQLWLLLTCGLAGLALAAFRGPLLAFVESRSFQGAAGDRARVASALEQFRLARGTREVAAVLERELREAVSASAVRVLVRGPETSGFADERDGRAILPAASSVVAILEGTDGAIDLSAGGSLRALLPQTDASWVLSHDVDIAASVRRRDGSLAAVVVLARRPGAPGLDARDLWLISTIAAGAGAVWGTDLSSGDELHREDDVALECPRCGNVGDSAPLTCCGLEAILAALPRRLNGRFLVVRRIGAGGMGVVYRAHDVGLGREVALKTLPELRDGAVARLRHEARAMAALNHESLATIYGLEMWRRTPVLVVEYFPGGTLASRLERGPLTAPAVLALGARLAGALEYMHAHGVLHRDLKPSNIGYSAEGSPKLLDFGLAVAAADASGDVPLAGTARYLPPEAGGVRPGVAFDLWALAVVLLEAAFGSAAVMEAGQPSRFLRIARDRGVLPAELTAVLERALAWDPPARFQTAAELRSALDDAVHGLS